MAATGRSLVRTTSRLFSSAAGGQHNHHQTTHQFLEHNSFLGSWEAPKNPKEAEKKLALLRREYAKQVKEVRKEYIKEMEQMRLEKQRKDEARREAIRAANEERKKLKDAAAKVRAEERKIADLEFRQTLMKERAEKLENWRMKEMKRIEKKQEKHDSLHRQSSTWVDETELEKKILEGVVNTTAL